MAPFSWDSTRFKVRNYLHLHCPIFSKPDKISDIHFDPIEPRLVLLGLSNLMNFCAAINYFADLIFDIHVIYFVGLLARRFLNLA